jgi:hypothetical protein
LYFFCASADNAIPNNKRDIPIVLLCIDNFRAKEN